MSAITSMQNKTIQEIRLLQQRKERRAQGNFIVEGIRNLEMALTAQTSLLILCYTPKALADVRMKGFIDKMRESACKLFEVSEAIMEKISQIETSQGLLGVCAMKSTPINELKSDMRVVILDRLQDPGNIGTVIRSAVAFGFDAVAFLPGNGDPWNDKVVRASAGTLFHMKLIEAQSTEDILFHLRRIQLPIVVTALDQAEELADQPWLKQPLALVVGNEGMGVSDIWLQEADRKVKIPMMGPAESLNVGVATGILLYSMQKK
ncbi:23S rRNA (uridine(2479)-2'-O)-methyltransferase [bioreactor metagenome]|uniref:23S rRNA (Uridine(2479)-2'-O)-methyltransferase n=1 Tax=bioreactor metagenome TaxID=1076179 RepID=A0A644YT81_9ZZZZ